MLHGPCSPIRHVCPAAGRGRRQKPQLPALLLTCRCVQKRLESPGLGLQVVVSHLAWALGTELKASAKALFTYEVPGSARPGQGWQARLFCSLNKPNTLSLGPQKPHKNWMQLPTGRWAATAGQSLGVGARASLAYTAMDEKGRRWGPRLRLSLTHLNTCTHTNTIETYVK